MEPHRNRRYSISEVSELTEVAPHLLRQWEARYPQLNPKRDRANRRYFSADDIEIVRRIKVLVRHDKLTTKGAVRQLARELAGEGAPKTTTEATDLIDKIQAEARAALDILDENRDRLNRDARQQR